MNPLKSIGGTLISGLILAVVIVVVTKGDHLFLGNAAGSMIIWLHVLAGITWIGLLYYFNFVQVPALGDAASDDGGPGGAGITKYVAPRALWWFRWGAVFTWLTGEQRTHGAPYTCRWAGPSSPEAIGCVGDALRCSLHCDVMQYSSIAISQP